VVVGFAVTRFDERHLIDVLGHVGVASADPLSAVAILLEGERALHQWAGIAKEGFGVGLLSVAFVQFRFGIEHVDAAWCAWRIQLASAQEVGRDAVRW